MVGRNAPYTTVPPCFAPVSTLCPPNQYSIRRRVSGRSRSSAWGDGLAERREALALQDGEARPRAAKYSADTCTCTLPRRHRPAPAKAHEDL